MAENSELQKIENKEWIASLQFVLENESPERARDLLQLLQKTAKEQGVDLPDQKFITDYINTISPEEEKEYPGDLELEKRIRAAVRWNAMAVVAKANKKNKGIG